MKTLRTPKTKRDGEVRAIKMLRDLADDQQSRKRYAPSESGKLFDAAMRESMTWPAAARRGFSYVCGDWLTNEVLGMGYAIDGYDHSLKRGKRGCDNA